MFIPAEFQILITTLFQPRNKEEKKKVVKAIMFGMLEGMLRAYPQDKIKGLWVFLGKSVPVIG